VTQRRTLVAVYILLGVAGLGAVLLAVLWLSHPNPDTLAFEAAKGCIGIFTIALVGFLLSQAASALQERRERWSRDLEELRDERQRKDELLRGILDDALANYHAVKRARRLLRARIWMADHGERIDPEVYDEYLGVINDAQLNFELLKDTTELIGDERVNPSRLQDHFGGIDKYLGKLVGEYEKHRRDVAHSDRAISIAELPTLKDFFNPDDSGPFRAGTTNHVNAAASDLRKALLEPLSLPSVAPGGN
jgi:hypothetical protein